MKSELQKQLYSNYPQLFKQKDFSIKESAMPWGVETGDGWFKLLDRLCYSIQGTIDCNHLPYQCEFTQIKEKYGILCLYHSWKITDQEKYKENPSERMMNLIDGMIDFAEAMSGNICEICGEWGENESIGGWWSTRCPKCRRKESRFNFVRYLEWKCIGFTSLPRRVLIKLKLIDCPSCTVRMKYDNLLKNTKYGCGSCGRSVDEILKLKEEKK